MGMFCTFFEGWDECLTGTKWKRYRGCSFLKTLEKRQSFLYQRQGVRDSKPNSWHNFSLDEPLVVPVIERKALYWIVSSLSWKELTKALS